MHFSTAIRLSWILTGLAFPLACQLAAEPQTKPPDRYQAIKTKLAEYEQIMDRYFRGNPITAAQQAHASQVQQYNQSVSSINQERNQQRTAFENRRTALLPLKQQIDQLDLRTAEKPRLENQESVQAYNALVKQRNDLVLSYNQKQKALDADVSEFNRQVEKANQQLASDKTRLEAREKLLAAELNEYKSWIAARKNEAFWQELNQTFALLPNINAKDTLKSESADLREQFRRLRQELGEYATRAGKTDKNSVVILPATVAGKEQGHFIVDTGAVLVTLTPEMVEFLGLKDRLGEETEVNLAAGKTAKGRKILIPSMKVSGLEEKNIPGIVMPLSTVGVDGLLGRSFLQRFVVSFDESDPAKVRLGPKK